MRLSPHHRRVTIAVLVGIHLAIWPLLGIAHLLEADWAGVTAALVAVAQAHLVIICMCLHGKLVLAVPVLAPACGLGLWKYHQFFDLNQTLDQIGFFVTPMLLLFATLGLMRLGGYRVCFVEPDDRKRRYHVRFSMVMLFLWTLGAAILMTLRTVDRRFESTLFLELNIWLPIPAIVLCSLLPYRLWWMLLLAVASVPAAATLMWLEGDILYNDIFKGWGGIAYAVGVFVMGVTAAAVLIHALIFRIMGYRLLSREHQQTIASAATT